MTESSQPPPESSRSRFTIPFEVPAFWTPEQALAVVELLDDLRELIWAHYDVRLIELIHAGTCRPTDRDQPSDERQCRRFLSGRRRRASHTIPFQYTNRLLW
jgi:hypothetical protein